jgi:alpha-beta hydrolase superfamily lysophospholipase
MQRTKYCQRNKILKWFLWAVFIQFLLINTSAALYAYRFTHLNNAQANKSSNNILVKTWRLFSGPKIYKLPCTDTATFPYQSIALKTKNNTVINAWYSSQDSAKGCVVFFHGYTANKSYLLKEAAQFKKWGYAVLLVDFRGHGASGGSTTFGFKESEEVVLAFTYAKAQGNKNIIFYGVSMGAVAIMKAASEKQVQPTALIVDMPFASLQHHYKSRARVIGFPQQPFAYLVTLWTGIENGYNAFDHNALDYAKGISCPVLVQWGTKDQYVTKEEIEKIFNNMASSNKHIAIYSNAGHESFLQVQPEVWEKEVTLFIAAL